MRSVNAKNTRIWSVRSIVLLKLPMKLRPSLHEVRDTED
jgi:hypothetical protein